MCKRFAGYCFATGRPCWQTRHAAKQHGRLKLRDPGMQGLAARAKRCPSCHYWHAQVYYPSRGLEVA